MSTVTVFSPAKINLFLSITGRRSDGFHDLVSVVGTLDFGDTLTATAVAEGGFTLSCDEADVPLDASNLILRAARAWEAAAPEHLRGRGVAFHLVKKIPMGAGLGGGSSNAVATLRALDSLYGYTTPAPVLAAIAGGLGSDCPLFLDGAPLVMRGRGERLAALEPTAAGRLGGRRVLVFKPALGISTVWAYQQMAAGAPGSYLPEAQTEAKLGAWLADAQAPAEALLFNNMEAPAFAKFVALPTLLAQLRAEFGVAVAMSGSGSACFALLQEEAPVAVMEARIREAWGAEAFVAEARILPGHK